MPAYIPFRGALNNRVPVTIDGRWTLVDGYIGGVRVPEMDLSRLTLTISNGRFTLGNDEGLVEIDSQARPHVIDIITTSGPNRGQFVPGIFECTREALRVCYDLAGISRPATFDSPPGARRFVALYRRDR